MTRASVTGTGDLLVVVPLDVAAGFRLAGTRTAVADSPEHAVHLVDSELSSGFRGVVAVAAQLWADVPPRTRVAWESSTVPLVVALPAETSEPAQARRERVRDLLARSVGYEITFTPEEGSR